MNNYFKNLSKIEFVVTNACTGRCKHCSQGEHKGSGEFIDSAVAADVVKKLALYYDIKTVMVYGGEPLLYSDVAFAILKTAQDLKIPKRQIITNGYFSVDTEYICDIAEKLYINGVNDLLLSVDAFHQETIPLSTVRFFAEQLIKNGVPVKIQPAWLVSGEDINPYNLKTREILESFSELKIPVGDGNVIFPDGNAKKYLSKYFEKEAPQNPYVENPFDVKCVSVGYDGKVLGDNIYRRDILEILNEYKP